MNPNPVFDLALTQVMQSRTPLAILAEITCHPFGHKDVAGIAAIHHALGHVYTRARDVRAPAHVRDLAHRSAVNAHAHRQLRVLLERFGNLERAARRLFRAMSKDQRHSITRWQPDELLIRRLAHPRCLQNNVSQLMEPLLLLFHQQLRIADNVDEQNVSDLQAEIVVRFGWHGSF
ncbi:MAG TPA: hypothetical protein VH207_11605 [Chthoniobacterales bacterium]|nr:hypothetical protein [Chthoniobacterales bacterium]